MASQCSPYRDRFEVSAETRDRGYRPKGKDNLRALSDTHSSASRHNQQVEAGVEEPEDEDNEFIEEFVAID